MGLGGVGKAGNPKVWGNGMNSQGTLKKLPVTEGGYVMREWKWETGDRFTS
jgi:hypothetical protein